MNGRINSMSIQGFNDEAMQRGEPLDIEAVCLKHPDLPQLREHLDALVSLHQDLSALFGSTQPLGPVSAWTHRRGRLSLD